MGYNLAKNKMIIPERVSYQKIQGNIKDLVDIFPNYCSDCGGMGNCNSPVFQNTFLKNTRREN